MITYKVWKIYVDEYWGWGAYDFEDIALNVLMSIPYILISIFSIPLDILCIPFYIVALIIWMARGCE